VFSNNRELNSTRISVTFGIRDQVIVRLIASIVAGGVLCLLSGCVNLASVRSFADLSAEAASYTDIVKDYPKSVIRLGTYAPAAQQATFEKREKIRQQQEKALLAMHAVLTTYMSNLGRLASDDFVEFDESAISLAAGFKAVGVISEKEITAAKSIIGLLGKAAADGYRRAKLAATIETSNADVQVIVNCLHDFVSKDYVASLADEKLAIKTAYNDVLGHNDESNSPGIVLMLREKHADNVEALKQRESAAAIYADTLAKIGLAHQTLYDDRKRLSAKEVAEDFVHYSKVLHTALAELQANSKG